LEWIIQLGTNSTASSAATTASTGLDPTVTAALVSAAISIIVWAAYVYSIEPNRWYSRYQITFLEKQVRVLGWLISILNACEEKAKRLEKPTAPHLLESDDVHKLEEIFEKNSYLLDPDLEQTWYDLQRGDTEFLLDATKRHERTASSAEVDAPRYKVALVDLTLMQDYAESWYETLREVQWGLVHIRGTRYLKDTELDRILKFRRDPEEKKRSRREYLENKKKVFKMLQELEERRSKANA
jgi:hypothetical protein